MHPEQSQYLGLNAGAITHEEHWEVRRRLDLEGLEGIANYAHRSKQVSVFFSAKLTVKEHSCQICVAIECKGSS